MEQNRQAKACTDDRPELVEVARLLVVDILSRHDDGVNSRPEAERCFLLFLGMGRFIFCKLFDLFPGGGRQRAPDPPPGWWIIILCRMEPEAVECSVEVGTDNSAVQQFGRESLSQFGLFPVSGQVMKSPIRFE